MMKHAFILIVLVLALSMAPASAQDGTCPTIVQQALDQVDALCHETTARNQACYGSVTLEAQPQPGIESLDFDAPGDIIDVTDIQSLRLSAMDENVPEWGVALLHLQANLPDTLPGQNVTVVLFGDVELEAARRPPETEVTVIAGGTINVRAEPSTTANVVAGLVANSSAIANGRDETGDWLRVELPNNRGLGWVHADLVFSDRPIDTLDVVATDDPVYSPLQAFYFRSGIGDSHCDELPNSGMLIRSPTGGGQISLLINEVTVTVGSTALVRAQPGETMDVYFISGTRASVTALGQTQSVFRGSRVSIPVNDDLQAIGPPELPEPYTEEEMGGITMDMVNSSSPIADPMTVEQIALRLDSLNPCRGTAFDDPVNVRQGPATDYPTAYQIDPGANRRVTGQYVDSDGQVWYQVNNARTWIRGDLIELNEHCDDIRVVQASEIPPIPTPVPTAAPGEPACGIIFDFAGAIPGSNDGRYGIESDWIYLLTGQQVTFTVSGTGQTWQGIRLKVFGPSSTIFNDEIRSEEGGTSPVSRTFIAAEDGWYYLEGEFGGGPDTSGSIFAEATCP